MLQDDALLALCDAANVAPDKPLRAEIHGEAYAVFVVDGSYYVTEDSCTHGPGSLSEGYLDGTVIECPFHQGCFDIRNGEPVSPPCTVPVRAWTAHLRDGKIWIDPKETRDGE